MQTTKSVFAKKNIIKFSKRIDQINFC